MASPAPTDPLVEAIAERLLEKLEERGMVLVAHKEGNDRSVLTPRQAAREVGVADKKIYDAIYSGELKHTVSGNRYRIRRSDLEAWEERR
jgi:excisionase family DNA binding protein